MWHCRRVAGPWQASEDHHTEDGGRRSLTIDDVGKSTISHMVLVRSK